MNKKEYKYLYGPVPSRRLGLSLGVDIIPPKYCTYNCIYCQLSHTDHHIIERRSFMPVDDVVEEIEQKISENSVKPDYITFSGSGEPTLNADIGSMIQRIKKITNIPVAVITNGSLLWMKEVRDDLLKADLLVPSMDAIVEKQFKKINRPHRDLKLDEIKRGLLDFSRTFKGSIWLEIMLVKDINDNEENINALVDYVKQLGPERVQLNTVARPPVESYAKPLNPAKLKEIATRFTPRADVTSMYVPKEKEHHTIKAKSDEILNLLSRRPCSPKDIENSLQYHPQEIMKALRILEEEGKIDSRITDGVRFYMRISK